MVARCAGGGQTGRSRASLDRFTIDRLERIFNRLDRQVQVGVTARPRGRDGHQLGAAHP